MSASSSAERTAPVLTEILERCVWCGGDVLPGSTCPRSLPCPRCGAEPGRSCRRPSGHRADTLHARRVGMAKERDAETFPAHPVLPTRYETQIALDLAVVAEPL